MPSVAILLRRARARILSRRLVPSYTAQRTCSRKSPPEDPTMALPGDMLIEIFKRLPAHRDIIRCAAVCRRWRRVISSGARAGCFPTLPRHVGFFPSDRRSSELPRFVATKVGVNLNVGFLPLMVFFRGAYIVDGCGGVLVLHERTKYRKLSLILCNPRERSFRRLPTLNISRCGMACAAFVPLQGAGFRVAVVLFSYNYDGLGQRYDVLVYDSASASSAWKKTSASRRRGDGERLFYNSRWGPSVVVGDVVYSLQEEHVMAVDTTKMTMSVVLPPVAGGIDWIWIGKTDDGCPCYFALDRHTLLHVERWALGADSKWTRQQPLRLPREFGEMPYFRSRVRIVGFCEGSRMLFFVIHDWVVSFNTQTLETEMLWRCETDEEPPFYSLRQVYPYEMAWPSMLKDFVN